MLKWRHRGEPAPAAVGREARRTVGTDRGIDHVTVLVGEAQTGEIGFDGIFRQSGAGIDDVGGHARHVERRRGIVLRINVRRAAPGLEERVTHHGPEFEIFADLAVIVGVEVDRDWIVKGSLRCMLFRSVEFFIAKSTIFQRFSCSKADKTERAAVFAAICAPYYIFIVSSPIVPYIIAVSLYPC